MLHRRAVMALPALAAPALAQDAPWPARPLRLIIPFAPGGSTDVIGRVAARGLEARLGQPVVVENRAGAGATLGSAEVARAAPDGYTLLLSNIASQGIGPALYRNVGYDAVAGFAHVAMLATNPSVFVVNPRFPARDAADLIRLSRETPGGLNAASSGAGSSNHLLIVRFAELTGARLNHIPYRGAGPAMTDVIAGNVPMMSDGMSSAAGHIRGGAVRAVAVSGAQRSPLFPDVPTFREGGVDLVNTAWYGLSAPAGTPAQVVARLAAEVRTVLADPALRARFAEFGGEPGDMGPEAYTAYVREEVARWAPVVRSSGASAE